MKLPTQDETEALISLATNHHAMRLLHELPRKIVKLLCAALKREHEMRVARDKKIRGLLNEIERQKDLRRAVPDVPELVRYHIDSEGMEECQDGEYVLHSQAAEIIAAKDNEIERLKFNSKGLLRRTEAAEVKVSGLLQTLASETAKLAQYEAQEPICWIPTATAKWLNEYDGSACAVQTGVHNKPIKSDGGVKLYASPAPTEDLKTKLSRYEQALRDIAAFKEKDRTDAATTQWNRAGVYAATIARAALNVEAGE